MKKTCNELKRRRIQSSIAACGTSLPLVPSCRSLLSENCSSEEMLCNSARSKPLSAEVGEETDRPHGVAFGTVAIREYERQIDIDADVPIGLMIGWDYTELQPIGIDSMPCKDCCYQVAEKTTELKRADILFETGFTREELKLAFEAHYFGVGKKNRAEGKSIFQRIKKEGKDARKKISMGSRNFLFRSSGSKA
mmetsp:Transcript_13838/g.30935  ORF Transcript_13838/g.30935 Transcript_13838/m.30935 type:complete len:194 (-) Transcript_13838:864-1445(-)